MKIISVVFLMLCINLSAQNSIDSLVAQIKEQYALLDKESYRQNLIESYKREQQLKLAILNNGSDVEVVKTFNGYESADSADNHFFAEQIRGDWERRPEIYVGDTQKFEQLINSSNPHFVLRLNIEDCQIRVDTSAMKFDLFWIDGDDLRTYKSVCILGNYVYTEDGLWPFMLNRVKRRAVNHLSRRNPTYMLLCDRIKGVMYMCDDKIYVYDFKTDWELNDYIKTELGKYMKCNQSN